MSFISNQSSKESSLQGFKNLKVVKYIIITKQTYSILTKITITEYVWTLLTPKIFIESKMTTKIRKKENRFRIKCMSVAKNSIIIVNLGQKLKNYWRICISMFLLLSSSLILIQNGVLEITQSLLRSSCWPSFNPR